jgi:hypothetical protein
MLRRGPWPVQATSLGANFFLGDLPCLAIGGGQILHANDLVAVHPQHRHRLIGCHPSKPRVYLSATLFQKYTTEIPNVWEKTLSAKNLSKKEWIPATSVSDF